MRRLPRIPIGLLAAATLLASTLPAGAQTTHPLYVCAERIRGGIVAYSDNMLDLLLGCAVNSLHSTPDCPSPNNVASIDGELWNEIKIPDPPSATRCTVETQRALCSLESRNVDLLNTHIVDPQAESVRADFDTLVADLFETEYDGCPRPTTLFQGSSDAVKCANKIKSLVTDQVVELEQCFFRCERNHLGDPDFCVNENTGVPADDEVTSCFAKETEDLADIAAACEDDDIVALGCPLGAGSVSALAGALATRLGAFAQDLNLGTFHASCRTSVQGPPAELVPADVTLEPSMTKKQVSCGQVLDSDFFGSDRTLSFDSDLDCGPVEEATNGIVVARSGVTINGRGKTRQILGPSRRSLRTGAGILLEPGVKRVTVTGFRRIANFGVGLQDAGNNKKLRVVKSTFFRNVDAGVSISSNRVKIIEVVADRNGIGLDIASNIALVKRCQVRGSEPQSTGGEDPLSPGYGIYLRGIDSDHNGVAARVTQSTVETNAVGVVLAGNGNILEDTTVRANLGDGVQIEGIACKVRNSSIKLNVGNGVVANGLLNIVNKNHSDENGGAGYVIGGWLNTVTNNGAGSPPSRGNVGPGYLITGQMATLDSNRAEANQEVGFAVQSPTSVFKGNRAEGNGGIGFEIGSTDNGLDSNVAESNGGLEWTVVADNVDQSGNRANGSSIVIPPDGGTFE